MLVNMPLCTCHFRIIGSRAGSVLLEQRVHHVANGRKQSRDHADNVPRPVSHLEGALEPNDRSFGLQRPENVHGDEL